MWNRWRRSYSAIICAVAVVSLLALNGCWPFVRQQFDDGTMTVRLVGADEHNGSGCYYTVTAGNASHVSGQTVWDGHMENTLSDADGGSPLLFDGGMTYSVAAWIDVNGDGDWTTDATGGVDYVTSHSIEGVIDGDVVVAQHHGVCRL